MIFTNENDKQIYLHCGSNKIKAQISKLEQLHDYVILRQYETLPNI